MHLESKGGKVRVCVCVCKLVFSACLGPFCDRIVLLTAYYSGLMYSMMYRVPIAASQEEAVSQWERPSGSLKTRTDVVG